MKTKVKLTKILMFFNVILVWLLYLFFEKNKIDGYNIFGGVLLFMYGGVFYKIFIHPLNEKYRNQKQEQPEKYERINSISYKIIYATIIIVVLLAAYYAMLPFINK